MSRTRRAYYGPMMGHFLAWLLVGLAVLTSNRSTAADTGSTSPFVAAGKAVCVHEVGNPWNCEAGFLEGSGAGNILYAGRSIAGGDFRVQARLCLARRDGTAAALVLDDDHIGLDGGGGMLFVEGPAFGPSKSVGKVAPFTPGRQFEIVLQRQGTTLTVRIDGQEVWNGSFHSGAVSRIGLRPHRGTMRVYDFSASGNLVDVPAGEWPPLKTDLFQSGKDGYTCYRIPAMVVTKRGVVLVFCAARKGGGGDWDPINIAMRRSTDNGRTWEPRRILLDQGKATVDNPTPIADRQSGAVYFLYQVNYARCFYMRSDDDGQTFTAPVQFINKNPLLLRLGSRPAIIAASHPKSLDLGWTDCYRK